MSFINAILTRTLVAVAALTVIFLFGLSSQATWCCEGVPEKWQVEAANEVLSDLVIESHQRVVIIEGLLKKKSFAQMESDLQASIDTSWWGPAPAGACIFLASKSIPGPKPLVISAAAIVCTLGVPAYHYIASQMKIQETLQELSSPTGKLPSSQILEKRLLFETCTEKLALNLLRDLERDHWPHGLSMVTPQDEIKKRCSSR